MKPLSPTMQVFAAWQKKAHDRYLDAKQELYDWLDAQAPKLAQVRTVSQQALAAASLAGSVAFHNPTPVASLEQAHAKVELQTASQAGESARLSVQSEISDEEFDSIMQKLREATNSPGHLPKADELYMEQQLSDILGFSVAAELEGNRLNHTIGIMGGEQHLRRFPDDSLAQHDAYQESGIAPNRGAFGWFTEQGQLTPEAIQKEKYYFAVQTLYLPNWNADHPYLKEWYKFRKMIVINPADRIAVVGVVGDAGPALWVKKQFGGSPEVIREGKIWSKEARGKVLLLFVDDPTNAIPLGPIQLSATGSLSLPGTAS